MADAERGKRGLRARWRERRAHRAERALQRADERARLKQARDSGGEARTGDGELVARRR
jgi:hypothetical protein